MAVPIPRHQILPFQSRFKHWKGFVRRSERKAWIVGVRMMWTVNNTSCTILDFACIVKTPRSKGSNKRSDVFEEVLVGRLLPEMGPRHQHRAVTIAIAESGIDRPLPRRRGDRLAS